MFQENLETKNKLARAVEELEALKAQFHNLECNHYALLQNYERAKQDLQYGINLGREMHKEYMYYKNGYEALLQHLHNAGTSEPSPTSITEIYNTEPESSFAVVPAARPHATPPEVCRSCVRMSSAKKTASVAGHHNNGLPSLHCAAIIYKPVIHIPLSRLVIVCYKPEPIIIPLRALPAGRKGVAENSVDKVRDNRHVKGLRSIFILN